MELKKRGALIQATPKGRTPVHCAAMGGNMRIMAELLDELKEWDMQDTSGKTPCMYALANGHEQIALLLLERGASHEVADSEGNTLLHFAAISSPTVVKMLIERGADSLKKNKKGIFPANVASNSEVIHLLAEAMGNAPGFGIDTIMEVDEAKFRLFE